MCTCIRAKNRGVASKKIAQLHAIFSVCTWQKSTGLHANTRGVTRNVLHGWCNSIYVALRVIQTVVQPSAIVLERYWHVAAKQPPEM